MTYQAMSHSEPLFSSGKLAAVCRRSLSCAWVPCWFKIAV